jgi:Flp pilus assembly protein TadD
MREAAELWPQHAPAFRGLGLASERLGRREQALAAYRRYLELAPLAPDADEVRARAAALGPSRVPR